MITGAQIKNINAYFIGFLNAYGDNQDQINELVDSWNSEEVQSLFKESVGAKQKKPRKKRVKGQPKKNKSAYLYFCADKREQVKLENPGLKTSEITSLLGDGWKELKEDDSRKDELESYTKQAAVDKIRYEDEKKNFVPPESDNEEEEKNEKKGKKEKKEKKTGPKRNKSAYLYFCQHERAAVKESLGKDTTAKEVTQELGKKWNELKEDDTRTDEYQEYVRLAEEDKKRYKDELAAISDVEGDKTDDDSSVVSSSSKSSKKVKVPSVKKGSADYVQFCRENRKLVKEANPDMSAQMVTSKLAEMWKEKKGDN